MKKAAYGEVHRASIREDRVSPTARERAKEHEGSWYGFRIGGLLALPAPDDVFEPTFLDDQLNRRRKSPVERFSLPLFRAESCFAAALNVDQE